MPSGRSALGARCAAFGAVALWGVSFVATKAALCEVSPVTLIFTRFALGIAVLVLVLKWEPLIPPRDTWSMLALMGFVGVFVHQMLQVHGLTLTTAVRTGWLIGLIPIWSAVCGVSGQPRWPAANFDELRALLEERRRRGYTVLLERNGWTVLHLKSVTKRSGVYIAGNPVPR